MPRIAADALRAFGTNFFQRKGLSLEDARFMAAAAVTTQAGGVASHGVVIFVRLERNPDGVTDPAKQPAVVRDLGGMAVIDCEGCYSQLGVRLAQRLGERKAREHGLAMIAVRNGSWLGGLGAFVLPLVRTGFLVQAWAQYSSCQDGAPPGGIDARLSTNPVCLGIPGAGGPLLADFSTTILSMGKTSRMARQGLKTDEPCFFDTAGRPSHDPRDMKAGGAMFMMGGRANGYKGFAFSLWAEALAAMAGGHTNNPDSERRQTFNLLVIDPDAFGDRGHYEQEMAHLAAWIKSSRREEGCDAIRLPGERFVESVAAGERWGVAVDDALLAELNALAQQYAIDPLQPVKNDDADPGPATQPKA